MPARGGEIPNSEDNDYVQAGNLYRLMDADAQLRLVTNIASSLGGVSRADIIERSVAHFRSADAQFGERVTAAIIAR